MTKPIGMFDSGLGGLTVMQQLVHKMPHEDIIYFGDTARLPYGGKSRETIIRYSIENAIFLIEKDVKILVVACNTATSHALDRLQQIFGIPVIGVIDPGAERAVETSSTQRIAVLATKGTIHSEAYQKAIRQLAPNAFVFPVACPLFVPLVEEGCLHHPATRLIVRDYLKPIKEQGVDTILLGCTHYPMLKALIQEEVGDHVTLVDSGSACAERVSSVLNTLNLQKNTSPPFYQYFVSDDPHQFQTLGSAFLGFPITTVCKHS
ncbi:MAG: glutamate racemase [Parachlamydiaceae bacterium]